MNNFLGPLVALAVFPLLATATLAQPPKANLYPDWPCVQHKVPTLTSVQIWDGGPVEDLKGWSEDPEIRKLVQQLASRRVPVEEAVAALDKYAASVPEAERDDKMKLVFAGLLDTVSATRTSILNGIERFQQRQRARAQELERQGLEIIKLRERAATEERLQAELTKAEELYQWDSRIFQERQMNMPLACEIPTLIDQRVFDLAREIRKHMKD